MKKLILTSVTICLIGFIVFAHDGNKCTDKCEKKCDQKESIKMENNSKKYCIIESKSEMKCGKDKECCKKMGEINCEKKENRTADNK